jgi:hypothetical protein
MPEASTLLLTTSHSAEVRIVSQHCATYAVRGTHIPKTSLFCLRTNAMHETLRIEHRPQSFPSPSRLCCLQGEEIGLGKKFYMYFIGAI